MQSVFTASKYSVWHDGSQQAHAYLSQLSTCLYSENYALMSVQAEYYNREGVMYKKTLETYGYTESSQLESEITQQFVDDEWVNTDITTYSYDGNDHLIENRMGVWSDASIPIACPVFVGIVAIGADGVGLATIVLDVVEHPADVMVYTRVTGENIDTYREKETSKPCCSGSVSVAVVGTGNERNVFSDVEHVVVFVGEVAEIVTQNDGVGRLLSLYLIEHRTRIAKATSDAPFRS